MIIGFITDRTGDMRSSFWFLLLLLMIPVPLLNMVDVERGKTEGEALEDTVEAQGQ